MALQFYSVNYQHGACIKHACIKHACIKHACIPSWQDHTPAFLSCASLYSRAAPRCQGLAQMPCSAAGLA